MQVVTDNVCIIHMALSTKVLFTLFYTITQLSYLYLLEARSEVCIGQMTLFQTLLHFEF